MKLLTFNSKNKQEVVSRRLVMRSRAQTYARGGKVSYSGINVLNHKMTKWKSSHSKILYICQSKDNGVIERFAMVAGDHQFY